MEYGARERSFVELREECLGVRVLESQADIPRSPKREVAADPESGSERMARRRFADARGYTAICIRIPGIR